MALVRVMSNLGGMIVVGNMRNRLEKENLSIDRMLLDNMLTKYQMIKFIDFCEVGFLPESVARVATIVGDHGSHTPRH
ncbi:hypothetical protein TNCV_351931 [Trichonephila clavipes]|nr:hypothetical protein TNCV_351931 [Trichonephila clavipes]